MTFRYHGNYCGPGWTAGKYMDAKDAKWSDFNKPATSKLDAICKRHDKRYWLAYQVTDVQRRKKLFKIADQRLVKEIKAADIPGVSDNVVSFAVWIGGEGKSLRDPDFNKEQVDAEDKNSNKRPAENLITPENKKTKTDSGINPKNKKRLWSEVTTDVAGNVDRSFSNLRPGKQAKVGMSTIVSGATGNHETPLDPVHDVERGVSDYQYASLPYTRIQKYGDNITTVDLGFRMTSPYNCAYVLSKTDYNSGAGKMEVHGMSDNQDNPSSAMWFNYYKSTYKYYSVVGAKWSVVFENLSNEALWVHQMYCGNDIPPVLATNQDILNWKNVNSHYVRPYSTGVGENGIETNQTEYDIVGETNGATGNKNYSSGNMINYGNGILQLSGSYKPGDYKRDINQDHEVEIWTDTSTNPTLKERLVFRIKSESPAIQTNSANTVNRDIRWRYHIKIDYLVEFKELKDGLKWPVNNNPAILTITNDATLNNPTT
jgi:hypothetical protein